MRKGYLFLRRQLILFGGENMKKIIWEAYPDDIITNPGKPYVYFTSLPNEILDKVAGYFNQDLNSFTDAKNNLSSVDQAFTFLKSVIASERAKENAFLQYLTDKMKGKIEIKIPNLNSNWEEFVNEIQQKLGLGNLGLTSLKNELRRLKQNQKNLQNGIKNPTTDTILAEKDALSKTQEHLQSIQSFIEKDKFSRQGNGYTIIQTVLNRYGSELLKMENDKLLLDETQLLALIYEISHIVSDSYTIKNYSVKNIRLNKNTLNQAIDDAKIDNQILDLIKRAQTMPWVTDNAINNYGLGKNATHKDIPLEVFTDNTNNIIQNADLLTERLFNLYKGYQFPSSAVKLVNSNNAMAEIDSLIKFDLSNALSTFNTGGAGAKPDNIIGYITIDPNQLTPLQPNIKAEVLSKIKLINDKINELVNSLSQSNTTEYYKEQAFRWNEVQAEIDNLLKELEDSYNILGNCFLLEDSTKNYLSLYANEGYESLHGGSLGANLNDQLNKIDVLTRAGGISMIDKTWLTAAIINSGQGMIASNQKNKLENYLAMFAAILLFDSQINIAEEALLTSTNNMSNSTSTHNIHLFSVNGGYYPLSYVLQLTYNSLTKGLARIQNEVTSQGVSVSISGYVKSPKPKYKYADRIAQFTNLGQQALNQTKIKMMFLVNFMNVLNTLLPE